jgi:hypothetical protein
VCANWYQTGAKPANTRAPRIAVPVTSRKVLIGAGATGLKINRPYAMNAVTQPSTRLTGKKKLYSPRAM